MGEHRIDLLLRHLRNRDGVSAASAVNRLTNIAQWLESLAEYPEQEPSGFRLSRLSSRIGRERQVGEALSTLLAEVVDGDRVEGEAREDAAPARALR